MRLLIVEDEDEMIFLLRTILNPELEVSVAKNFKEAQALLESQTFDIVITDYNFPFGNGDQVAELARSKGVKHIALHSGSVLYTENLYDVIAEKLRFKVLSDFLKKVIC